jgi:hypothetical protein
MLPTAEKVASEEGVPDPRRDLVRDSVLWTVLLNSTDNRELQGILHGFRCCGTRLVNAGDAYVLRPEYGQSAWDSEQEYAHCRDTYLVPHREEIVALLQALRTTR